MPLAALDSNVLIYAEDMFGDARRETAIALLGQIPPDRIVIPLQAIGETLRFLIKKAKVPRQVAIANVSQWLENFRTEPTSETVIKAALDLVRQHRLQVFDAIILASAAEAGADILLSEDMQDGFRWRGVTVANPFLPDPNPLIRNLLAQ